MNTQELENKIRAYALKNAIHYGGKANQGAVISALFNEGLEKKEVKEYSKRISEIVREVNKLLPENQKKEFEKLEKYVSYRKVREGLAELPNADNGVVMRFAPSASGGLHIGHTITACLSFLYVKKYGGKFYVRIEDTNPENVYGFAYDMIEDEARWLFGKKAKMVIQSNRMDLYYAYAVSLIEKGHAYVCTCSADDFRDFVSNKKNCPCRDKKIQENIKDWEKMISKNGFEMGKAVLRFKSNMKHKNPAMRDFPLARINLTPHPLHKKKYRVWPLMNLAVAVDDIEMGMTHIIRGKDHRDNAERQRMIYDALEKKSPWTGFIGRIHFKGMMLSTTKFREGIKQGLYSGWDDPNIPTLASLRKQGYKPEAFMKFSEHIGLSEVDKIIDKEEYFKLLNAFNRG